MTEEKKPEARRPDPADLAPTRCPKVAELLGDPCANLSLGMLVRAPHMPEWGLGQIQSITGTRVTVNFEHAGKRVMFLDKVSLQPAEDE